MLLIHLLLEMADSIINKNEREHKVRMNVKMRKVRWRLFLLSLSFFFVMQIVLPTSSWAQQKGNIRPKTAQSEDKREIPKQPKKQETPKRSLVPQGKQADVTIFATGNVLGYIEPCG